MIKLAKSELNDKIDEEYIEETHIPILENDESNDNYDKNDNDKDSDDNNDINENDHDNADDDNDVDESGSSDDDDNIGGDYDEDSGDDDDNKVNDGFNKEPVILDEIEYKNMYQSNEIKELNELENWKNKAILTTKRKSLYLIKHPEIKVKRHTKSMHYNRQCS